MASDTLNEVLGTQYEFLDTTLGRGGNREFKCSHCGQVFKGSQTRQIAHLIGPTGKGIKLCETITMEVQDELRTEINEIIGASAGPGPGSSSQTFASQSGACPRLIILRSASVRHVAGYPCYSGPFIFTLL